MSKARLEADRAEYDEHMRVAHDAENRRDYAEAIRHAMAALEHVDAMMKFERRYEETEFDSVPCIDMVVRLAPLIFHAEGIERVRAILKQHRAVERNTSADLAKTIDDAAARMAEARRLWNHIEANPGVSLHALQESLGGDPRSWQKVLNEWKSLDIATVSTQDMQQARVWLSTPIDGECTARCPSCFQSQNGPWSSFLQDWACSHCSKVGAFVMTALNANDRGAFKP